MLDAVARLADEPRPTGSFPYGSPDRRRHPAFRRPRTRVNGAGTIDTFVGSRTLARDVSAMHSALASRTFRIFIQMNPWWGGWGLNPRPADYEKYGPGAAHRPARPVDARLPDRRPRRTRGHHPGELDRLTHAATEARRQRRCPCAAACHSQHRQLEVPVSGFALLSGGSPAGASYVLSSWRIWAR